MNWNQVQLITALLYSATLSVSADVIINQPAAGTNPSVPAAVVVPVPAATSVVAPAPVVTDLDREGDWYVVYGTADVDRFHNILRVKDEKHGWITIAYRDGVEIYRRGQHISYMDVNPGDTVTVRFKSS